VRRLTVALTITTAGVAATTGTAQAAPAVALSPVKPCYLSGEEVNVAFGGFTPNGTVSALLDGTAIPGVVTLDAAGAATAPFRFGLMRGVESHTLTATDGANPALTASLSFMGTTNRVNVRPRRARAGVRLRLSGSGFLAGPRVYMHVRGRGYKADRRVGRVSAPCGTFTARERIVPASARSGRYRVQFDASRRYSKRTTPKVVGTMTVTRRIRSSAAAAAWAR
jgi:hypothetical protein